MPRLTPASWEEEEILGLDSESKVPVDSSRQRLKAVCRGKDGDRKRVSVSRSQE